MNVDPEHSATTRKNKYRYCFTSKHHGGGTSEDAQWHPQLSRDEEFAVFDEADYRDISDDNGWFYGVLCSEERQLRDLGTWSQQVAEFPKANVGVPWHGYPIWAVNSDAPSNRAGEKMRPPKSVFLKLETVGLITKQQRKRLLKGQHA
ncbi:MAG: hypothetical protein HY289_12730 [Planctomycetes bacterium]|nr:hypothetical protein [Planctomycetota bacterium]